MKNNENETVLSLKQNEIVLIRDALMIVQPDEEEDENTRLALLERLDAMIEASGSATSD